MAWAAYKFKNIENKNSFQCGFNPICIFDRKAHISGISLEMDSDQYMELLAFIFIPFTEEIDNDNLIFQHDNAAVHTSHRTKQWFNQKDIKAVKLPACSPNFNPIENLWKIVAKKVYRNCKQYNSIDVLPKAICEAWASIDEETLRTFIFSLPNRIFQVIQKIGNCTDY